MKFDQPATTNPIDQLKVIGHPHDRIDGPLKTTGHAPYAYERHDIVADPAYGFILGSAIAKGRIGAMYLAAARAAPGRSQLRGRAVPAERHQPGPARQPAGDE